MSGDTIAWARPEDVGVSRERLGRLSEALERDIEAGLLPGAVALVTRRGRIVHFKAYGRRDPRTPDPMALDTLFRIYSMTKPVVSVAAAMLAEEGRLRLDAPLADLIPAFAQTRVARIEEGEIVDLEPPARPILVHDLLRHTSGLAYGWSAPEPLARLYADAGIGARERTNAEDAVATAALPLAFQPGTRWGYGRSTDILGRVVEIVSGETLRAHLDGRVLGPLGMLETGFQVPAALAGRLAEPFPLDPETGEPVRLLDVASPSAAESGGGGLAGTASDYARFLHMLSSGGALDGHRLLSPATLAWMMSDHLGPEVEARSDLLPDGYGFGLGFAVRRGDGVAPFPGSAGDAFWYGGGGTSFWIDPARDLAAILLTQAPGRRDVDRVRFRHLVYAALTE